MKSDHVFATVMTAALFSALGYLALKENPLPHDLRPALASPQHFPGRMPEARPGHPAPSAPALERNPRTRQRQANGLYKCVVAGQTSYQDQPCEKGEQMEVEGRMSVVPRYPVASQAMAPAPNQQQPVRSHASATSAPVAGPAGAETQQEYSSCASLRNRIRNIDAQARRRSTQRLTDERREVGKQMSKLKCSFMD